MITILKHQNQAGFEPKIFGTKSFALVEYNHDQLQFNQYKVDTSQSFNRVAKNKNNSI